MNPRCLLIVDYKFTNQSVDDVNSIMSTQTFSMIRYKREEFFDVQRLKIYKDPNFQLGYMNNLIFFSEYWDYYQI